MDAAINNVIYMELHSGPNGERYMQVNNRCGNDRSRFHCTPIYKVHSSRVAILICHFTISINCSPLPLQFVQHSITVHKSIIFNYVTQTVTRSSISSPVPSTIQLSPLPATSPVPSTIQLSPLTATHKHFSLSTDPHSSSSNFVPHNLKEFYSGRLSNGTPLV